MENGIRIQKVLSEQGIASRRKVEEWITQGKIKVNGRPAVLGQKINPNRDVVAIDGERVYFQKSNQKYYIMLHKPRGYVTTMSDELGRKCVAELVEDVPERVYPIGRLDKDSEGMLLFTNDGDFANLIMHPSHHVSKTYRVTVRPDISDAQVVQLSTGVEIDGKRPAPPMSPFWRRSRAGWCCRWSSMKEETARSERCARRWGWRSQGSNAPPSAR